MTKTVNERGFSGYCDFTDTYKGRIRVQQSSAAMGPHVWVFIDSQLDASMPFSDGPDSFSFQGEPLPSPRRIYITPDRRLVPEHPINVTNKTWTTLKQTASAHLSRDQARTLRNALTEYLDDQDELDRQARIVEPADGEHDEGCQGSHCHRCGSCDGSSCICYAR